jgi:hypothetical protein
MGYENGKERKRGGIIEGRKDREKEGKKERERET